MDVLRVDMLVIPVVTTAMVCNMVLKGKPSAELLQSHTLSVVVTNTVCDFWYSLNRFLESPSSGDVWYFILRHCGVTFRIYSVALTSFLNKHQSDQNKCIANKDIVARQFI